MNIKRGYQIVINAYEFIAKWVIGIGIVILAVGYISQFFSWGNRGLFIYLKNNIQNIWLLIITLTLIGLLIWMARFDRRFINRFFDDFSSDLKLNWDYVGPWRIADANTLLVTGSDEGGITKVGSTWENYTLTFDAKINNACLGFIVRALDLDNYYMFQINTDKIRPHRRVAIPVLQDLVLTKQPANPSASVTETKKYSSVVFQVAWQIFDTPNPINPPLSTWFKVKAIVRGESIKIYINNELCYQQEAFLKIPTGKIGFRNNGAEAALVKNVRVLVHS